MLLIHHQPPGRLCSPLLLTIGPFTISDTSNCISKGKENALFCTNKSMLQPKCSQFTDQKEPSCAQKVESQKHWWTPQPEMETKLSIWRVWDTSAIKNKYQKSNLALQIQSYFNARCNRHLTIFPFPSANSAPNYLVLWSGWIHFSSKTSESDPD